MSDVLACCCVTLLLALIALHAYRYFRARSGMTYQRAARSGRTYYVKDLPDRAQAADTLARLEERMLTFRRYLAGSTHRSDPRVVRVLSRWDGTLSETDWQNAGEAAYSVNKAHISMCVRNAAGQVEDLNTAVFVLLHELAHVCTEETGHTRAFWANMAFLMKLAIQEAGVYKYQRFESQPGAYCGHAIRQSPFTCYADGKCDVK